jgi:hypothetical protein
MTSDSSMSPERMARSRYLDVHEDGWSAWRWIFVTRQPVTNFIANENTVQLAKSPGMPLEVAARTRVQILAYRLDECRTDGLKP